VKRITASLPHVTITLYAAALTVKHSARPQRQTNKPGRRKSCRIN